MNWKDIKNLIKEELKEATTVNAGGLPVNRTGDNDDCLHARVGGSNNVNVG